MKRIIFSQYKAHYIDTIHIFVLFGFAVAQPLFDLLSRNATFFVVHRSEPIDVIILIFILCVLLPALVIFIEVVVGLLGQKVRKGVHGFMVASLVAIIALPALNKIFQQPGIALLTGGAILGVTITVAYFRFHAVRLFMTVLLPATLLFPGLFLFNSPVSKLVFVKDISRVPNAVSAVNENIPVVLIVFDALSLPSLMDGDHEIDSIRYPNFAALAQDATWFRNATAVSDYTHMALPAILSGLYPDKPRLPTITDYPRNIFTLLGRSYDFVVSDRNTQLCPDQWDRHEDYKNFSERVSSLLSDLSVVYLHIVLPSDLRGELPVVTRSWKNFTGNERGKPDKNEKQKKPIPVKQGRWPNRLTYGGPHQILRFIKNIHFSERPMLYYLHAGLPHAPWRYLPSGKEYSHPEEYKQIRGLSGYGELEMWSSNELAVVQGYQRYLLQLGFTDRILGAILDRIKEVSMYDRSLIIVTADHGVSFRINDKRRPITESNYQDIMPVPLFIKVPNQDQGAISDRNVETIDILPSIAEVLGISLPWPVDGQPVFNGSLPERNSKLFFTSTKDKKGINRLVFEKALEKKYDTVDKMLTLFGSGLKPDGLFGFGPHINLLGQQVDEIKEIGKSGFMVEIDRAKSYEHVDPDASFVPARISGVVMVSGVVENPLNLAVSVNGIMRAVTMSNPIKDGVHEWSAIVSESSFQPGENNINVFHLAKHDETLRIYRMRRKTAVDYFLSGSGKQDGEKIITSEGRSIPIIPGAIKGWLDHANISNGRVRFSGWAADIKNSEAPDGILIFSNGKIAYSGRTNMERADVVNHFNDDSLQLVGFSYALHFGDFKDIHNQDVRVFAFSRNVASELSYSKNYKWHKKL